MDSENNLSRSPGPEEAGSGRFLPADYLFGIQAIVHTLRSARTIGAVAEVVVSHTLRVIKADIGFALSLSQDGTALETLFQQGLAPEQRSVWKTLLTSSSTPMGLAVRERRTVQFQNQEELASSFPDFPNGAGSGVNAIVVLPLLLDDRVLGCIGFCWHEPHGSSGGEAVFLEIVAGQAAQALDQALLRERLSTAQAAAEQAAVPLRGLLDCTTDLIAAMDMEGRFLVFNKAYEEDFETRFGARIKVGMSIYAALAHLPQEQTRVRNAWSRIAAGEAYTYTAQFENADGSRRFYEINSNTLRDKDGHGFGVVSVVRDITNRSNSEQALRESEARLAQAQSIAKIGSWDLNIESGTGAWSTEMFRLMGFDPAEGIPSYDRFLTHVHPEDVPLYVAMDKQAREEGSPRDFEFRVRYPDATEIWLHALGRSEKNAEGKVIRSFGTVMDISERKAMEDTQMRLQQQFHQAQKMESIGRLAGGIAHDFNNLLSIILGYAEVIEEELTEDSPQRSRIRIIANAASRASSLTLQILSFARRQPTEPKILSLNGHIEDMTDILRPLIGEDIHLQTDLKSGVGKVRIDAHQLEQILINLVVNARDAMPRGGALTIETAEELITEPRVYPQFTLPSGRYVSLSVSDTGTGMTEEVKNRIFEPFFTTKESGKGTGLGLATVYGIVKQNNGFILAESEPGKGAVFTIYLPRSENGLEPAGEPLQIPARLRGAGTVLVVEDEPLVREMVVLTLQRNGYVVLQANNGVEALQTAEAYPDAIDLLLTDAIMPNMGGPELAERLREKRATIQILLTSGYAEDRFKETHPPLPGASFLSKPFTPNTLLEKVRVALERPNE